MAQPHVRRQLTRRGFLAVTGGVAAGIAATGHSSGAAAAVAQQSRDYVSLVDPFWATDTGRYFFFESAANPFGFVKLRPDTDTSGYKTGGYRTTEHYVKGFAHVHEWRVSGVQVMPTSGASVPKTGGDTGWQSYTKHDASEVAQPGYHKLHLDTYGITAELTCTDRAGLHRYTYDQDGPSEIIINLGGVLGEAAMKSAQVTKVSNDEIEGFVVLGENAPNGGGKALLLLTHKLFFDIRFDRPFDSLHGWAGGALANGGAAITELAGEDMGVYARYNQLRAGDVIQMKVGLSFTGTDGARKNLEAELPGWVFDDVKANSQRRWNEMLGRIDVQGGTQQQQVKFYTDLFHALCGRGMASDADGLYLDDTWGIGRVRQIPLDEHGTPKFAMYNSDALWGSQWNLNILWGLAYPEIYSSFVHSQLQMYQDGGLLWRGPAAGNYTLIMVGAPVTSFITGAWNKGIRDFDIGLAYDAMLDAHSIGGLFDKGISEYNIWTGVGGARQYMDMGYIPYELGTGSDGGAGLTLEYSFQDWGLGQLAGELDAKGLNISQFAEVTVSSQLDDTNYAGERAVDGRPIRSSVTPPQNVEWASAGERNPWIKLSWREETRIHKVVLSDRADRASNVNSGTLTFSDGSSITVSNIPADGRNKVVAFPWKRAGWVKFQVTGGTGENVGLNEIEVWDNTDVHAYLLDRSANWQHLFDRSTGFIRPRGSYAQWLDPFDPLSASSFPESNAWQHGWFTVHDVMGLANRLGGRKAYADKLGYAFEQSAAAGFIQSNGYVNYGNQPSMELAHLFNYVGYPWLTQYWVRQVQKTVYGGPISTINGYGQNDEDQGQMGSLSALMAIGLFEVTGGSLPRPVYDITSPIFDEVTINLNPDYYPGRTFRIITHDNSAANSYIQHATLNGQELDNAWLYHDQLASGGTLELWMGDQPNTGWGARQLPPSKSPEAPVTAFTTPDYAQAQPGQSTVVKLQAQNLTATTVAASWQASAQGGVQPQPATGTLEVPPNGPASQDVTLQVPAYTAEGVYRVRFPAVTADGTELPAAILYLHIAPTVSLSVKPSDLTLLQATPAAFQVQLTNNDTELAHDTQVGVQAPQGWQVDLPPGTVTVPAGGVATPAITITPPADATGAATLTVTAQGAWGSSSNQVVASVSPKIILVGNMDLSTAEFALSPGHYASYPTAFPNDIDFTVGTDDPATAWSYIHPGPGDNWAGSKPHNFTLRFNLDTVTGHDLAFTAWLVDTQTTIPATQALVTPTLALTLNGGPPTTIQMPVGGGDGNNWGSGKANLSIRPTSFDFALPASQLHAGENLITITTVTGSWIVYDAFGIREVT